MRAESRRRFVSALASGAFAPLASAVGSVPLIEPGRQPGPILVPIDASPSELWAAEELRRWLDEITGASLRIEKEGDALSSRPAPLISLGPTGFAARHLRATPGGESFALRTVGSSLVISGGRQRGTLYGAYELLHRLGCRWYTEDIFRIPKQPHLRVPRWNEIVSPAFRYREVFFAEAQGPDWSARNRLNGHFHRLDRSRGEHLVFAPFAHSFYEFCPPGQYFASHPEYFALVAGRRRPRNAQLCLTNPGVLRLAVDRARQWMDENPDAWAISISQNDGAGWCECGPCRAVFDAEGGNYSGLLLRLVNSVAAETARSHPGRLIDTLAYRETLATPGQTRPAPNVHIRFCPIEACAGHSWTSCLYNTSLRDQLRAWAAITPRLTVWQYAINFSHFLLPFPNTVELAQDIPWFASSGVSGVFVEGASTPGSDDAELRSWLAARLLWNPSAPLTPEVRGFLNAVYGPAAGPMQRYYDLRNVTCLHGEHLWVDQGVGAPYLTASFLDRAARLLREARNAAVDDAARRRVDHHVLGLDYVRVMRHRRVTLRGTALGPEAIAASETTGLIARARALGITHLREGFPVDAHESDLAASARDFAVVRLSSGADRCVVAPELGARVIAWQPDAAPANLLAEPAPGDLYYPLGEGLAPVVGSNYLESLRNVRWSVLSAAPDETQLTGATEDTLSLRCSIVLKRAALRVTISVSNTGSIAIPVIAGFQMSLPFGPESQARIDWQAPVGQSRSFAIDPGLQPVDGRLQLDGSDAPVGGFSLLRRDLHYRLAAAFSGQSVGRCGVRWSFRGPRSLSLSIWSPEADLLPGAQTSATLDLSCASA